jgi:hypothetical protein
MVFAYANVLRIAESPAPLEFLGLPKNFSPKAKECNRKGERGHIEKPSELEKVGKALPEKRVGRLMPKERSKDSAIRLITFC